MSVETQIGSLVEAANNLTGEVAGKLQEIDSKVDEATKAVPDVVRGMASVSFVVNYETGDDETGDGSATSPFKTVLHAVQRAASGARVQVNLQGNVDHVCEVPADQSHHNAFHGKSVELYGDRSRHTSGTPSVLRFRATPWKTNPGVARCNFFEGSVMSVSFFECDLASENTTGLPRYGHDGSTGGDFGGIFTRGTTMGGALDLSVYMHKCSVNLTGDLAFATGIAGNVDFYAQAVNLAGDTAVPVPMIKGNFVKGVVMNSAGISGFNAATMDQVFGYDPATTSGSVVLN